MPPTPKEIETIVDRLLPDIIELRHQFHQIPELAGEEVDTSALIRSKMKDLDVELLDPFLETDVVALARGKAAGKNIALRADFDALPLHEKTGVPYQSKRDGLMHACGHDGHTAILIGTAMVLNELKDHIRGTVRYVFQPGEEVIALGKPLVDAGCLKDPEPDMVMAFHAFPGLPAGAIGGKCGAAMAAAEFFKITVKGKGAHGSMPQQAIDPIVTGSRIVEALQTILARNVSALDAVVVNICRFTSGFNGNVIPDDAILEGTVRYIDPKFDGDIQSRIERIIGGVCATTGAEFELDYKKPYIPLINDEKVVALGRKITEDIGAEWKDIEETAMGSEDFSYFVKDYPGAMFRLGQGENSPSLHNPKFNFNDDAIKPAMMFFTATVFNEARQ